jgi:hypothetical protein
MVIKPVPSKAIAVAGLAGVAKRVTPSTTPF